MTARETDETPKYPRPWKMDGDGDGNYIRDATGHAIAGDTQYYPWIETGAMPMIVEAINAQPSLFLDQLRALEATWRQDAIDEDHAAKSAGRELDSESHESAAHALRACADELAALLTQTERQQRREGRETP